MRRFALFLLCCVFATVALATTPPMLPPNLPPLRVPAVPRVHPTPNPGPPFGAWTRDKIRELNLSSTVKLDLLRHLFPEQPQIATSADMETPDARMLPTFQMPQGRFAIQPNTTVDPTFRADNDASQDIEPAIITNRYTENDLTVDRTTTVFTKLDANGVPSHWWTSTTDFAMPTPQAQASPGTSAKPTVSTPTSDSTDFSL